MQLNEATANIHVQISSWDFTFYKKDECYTMFPHNCN